MSNIITINNVRAFVDENGIAQLSLEDAARGLGFTEIAKSGNEVVRWARVNKYLVSIGFVATSGDGFIPENIFYLLAMKANNEAAKQFQNKVANEILPALRKTGTYSLQPMSMEDMMIAQLQSMKEIKSRIEKLEQAQEKKADILQALPPAKDMTARAAIRQVVDSYCARAKVEHQAAYNELYTQFFYRYGVNLSVQAKNRGISKIEAAEQGGYLPELLSAAISLFG